MLPVVVLFCRSFKHFAVLKTKEMAYREKRESSSETEHRVEVKFLVFVLSLEGPSALS